MVVQVGEGRWLGFPEANLESRSLSSLAERFQGGETHLLPLLCHDYHLVLFFVAASRLSFLFYMEARDSRLWQWQIDTFREDGRG